MFEIPRRKIGDARSHRRGPGPAKRGRGRALAAASLKVLETDAVAIIMRGEEEVREIRAEESGRERGGKGRAFEPGEEKLVLYYFILHLDFIRL